MKKEIGSHLPAPPVGCFCPNDGLIPTAPPKTSMVTNQYICIFESHSSPYLFQEFICSHSNVSHFTPLYNEIVTSIWVISAWEAYCRSWQRKLIRCRPYNLAVKTISLLAPQFQQQVTNSLRTIQLWHRITNSLQNTKFSSECKFAATTQFRQQITNSLHNTQFDSEC